MDLHFSEYVSDVLWKLEALVSSFMHKVNLRIILNEFKFKLP